MIYPVSWAFSWPYFLSALAVGYLLGSIPFGMLVTRLAGVGDIRTIGSGNIGATNVLRTGRKGLAALTVALDAGKGTLAVLVALGFGPDIAIVTALGAILGHMFPMWLKFRGGKGVATGFGVLLALSWPVALAVGAAWLTIVSARPRGAHLVPPWAQHPPADPRRGGENRQLRADGVCVGRVDHTVLCRHPRAIAHKPRLLTDAERLDRLRLIRRRPPRFMRKSPPAVRRSASSPSARARRGDIFRRVTG